MRRGESVQLAGVRCLVLDRASRPATWWVMPTGSRTAVEVKAVRGAAFTGMVQRA